MAGLNLAEIMRLERDAVAVETKLAQCPPLVAVNQLDDIARVPSRLRYHHPVAIGALAGSKGAFVADCPTLQYKALWVTTSNDSYREDYLTFLNQSYGLSLPSLPDGYDVDHLYNRSRARGYGLKYVRTALVGYVANRSHGAAYEKDLTRNEARRERQDIKLMDEITSMKYFGFLSPLRSDPRPGEVAAYVAFASSKLGLDPDRVRESVAYLRQKASTPWARK
jgi:hypothetical protein